MNDLFRYLIQYETHIYILLGIAAMFAFRSVWLSWSEWRKAVFGLEKEVAYQRVRTNSAVAIVLVMFGLSQFCLVTFVVPYLPAITFTFTATPDLATNSLSANTPDTQQTPESEIFFTPPEITGCAPGEIIITSLESRQEISGRITLLGTADVENFGFYKYEYSQQGAENWVTIAAGREAVQEDELGVWDTSTLLPGDYEIRLVVVTGTGESLPACTIPVRIVGP